MRLAKPKLKHPPETYAAIIKENKADPVRMAQILQSLNWTLADAAWAAVNWSPEWLAAAIANAKEGRGIKLHSLSDDAVVKLKTDFAAGKSPDPSKPRRTTRIIRNKPKDK